MHLPRRCFCALGPMDGTFTEPCPEDDDTIGGAYIHAQEFSDEDCEYYDPDRFYKKVQEEPASSALVDFAKVLQTPSTRTSSRFRRNRPVPVARSLADHRKIKSGRHMSGDMTGATVLSFESGTVATGSSFPAGICELRWVPASKAGSIHVVNSGEVPEQTGKTLLCVAVGRSGPHAARELA